MKKRSLSVVVSGVLLTIFVFLTVFPFYIMIVTSTKTPIQFATNFWGVGIPISIKNYVVAWNSIYKYILNSFAITFLTVLGILFVAVPAGYSFAKMKMKGKNALYVLVLAFSMIPFALLLIPMYMNVLKLGLVDNYLGVILPNVAMGSILPIILSRSFFEGIPDALFESARIDGANELHLITKIVLPLSKPIIGTISLISFFGIFNQFMWPYIILSSDNLKTIPLGLNKLSGQFGVDFGFQMAAYTLVSIPLVIMILSTSKIYLEGITAGAIKA